MKRIAPSRAVLALAVAAALGFGATQSLAAPREAERQACDLERCDRSCKRVNPILVGVCMGDVCQCLRPVPID